jgi:hypothetical protein
MEPDTVHGKTMRRAYVAVENRTGRSLRAVTVIHKYSNEYIEGRHWDVLEPGVTPDLMQVRYNTGFGTTGKDWWLVMWIDANGGHITHTNPHNFRELIDFFEKIAPAVAGAIAVAVTEGNPWAGAAGNALVSAFTNGESTAGYKQHILRDEDAGQTARIVLQRNGKVDIVSASGTSETGTTSVPLAG